MPTLPKKRETVIKVIVEVAQGAETRLVALQVIEDIRTAFRYSSRQIDSIRMEIDT